MVNVPFSAQGRLEAGASLQTLHTEDGIGHFITTHAQGDLRDIGIEGHQMWIIPLHDGALQDARHGKSIYSQRTACYTWTNPEYRYETRHHLDVQ